MKKRITQWIGPLVTLVCVLSAGCHREAVAPPPLALEQIPVEFEKAFKSASQELKDLSTKVTSALQSKDYSAAYEAVQALCSAPDGSKGQKSLAGRAMLTITGLLQTAQAQGDQKAAEVLQDYKRMK